VLLQQQLHCDIKVANEGIKFNQSIKQSNKPSIVEGVDRFCFGLVIPDEEKSRIQ
jgi:hypothetical protein